MRPRPGSDPLSRGAPLEQIASPEAAPLAAARDVLRAVDPAPDPAGRQARLRRALAATRAPERPWLGALALGLGAAVLVTLLVVPRAHEPPAARAPRLVRLAAGEELPLPGGRLRAESEAELRLAELPPIAPIPLVRGVVLLEAPGLLETPLLLELPGGARVGLIGGRVQVRVEAERAVVRLLEGRGFCGPGQGAPLAPGEERVLGPELAAGPRAAAVADRPGGRAAQAAAPATEPPGAPAAARPGGPQAADLPSAPPLGDVTARHAPDPQDRKGVVASAGPPPVEGGARRSLDPPGGRAAWVPPAPPVGRRAPDPGDRARTAAAAGDHPGPEDNARTAAAAGGHPGPEDNARTAAAAGAPSGPEDREGTAAAAGALTGPEDRARGWRRTLEQGERALRMDAAAARRAALAVLQASPPPVHEVRALALLGDAERRLGERARAAETYERLARHPAGGAYAEEALYRRARLLVELGRRGEAESALATAQDRAPSGALLPERARLGLELLLARGGHAEARALLALPALRGQRGLDPARLQLARALWATEPAAARALLGEISTPELTPEVRALLAPRGGNP